MTSALDVGALRRQLVFVFVAAQIESKRVDRSSLGRFDASPHRDDVDLSIAQKPRSRRILSIVCAGFYQSTNRSECHAYDMHSYIPGSYITLFLAIILTVGVACGSFSRKVSRLFAR